MDESLDSLDGGDFTAAPGEFVWMQHAETGGKAQIAVGAVEAWRRLGWSPCEAPPEIDPTMIEYQPRVAPQPVLEDETEHPEVVVDLSESTDEGVNDRG